MSRAELQASAQAILATDRAAEDHPAAEELLSYHRRRLAAGRRERLADHLAVCVPCARTVVDMATFPEVEPLDPERRLDAAEVARRWQRLRLRLVEEAPERPAAPSPSRLSRWWPPFSSPRFAWGVVAALLAVTVALTSALIRERGPRLNLEIAELVPERGDGPRDGAAAPAVRVRSSSGGVLVVLAFVDPRTFPGYEVEVLPEAGGPGWSTGSLERSPEGIFTFQLPRGFLAAGRYRIELNGVRGGERELLAVYRLELGYD